jgi:hypothetical protein
MSKLALINTNWKIKAQNFKLHLEVGLKIGVSYNNAEFKIKQSHKLSLNITKAIRQSTQVIWLRSGNLFSTSEKNHSKTANPESQSIIKKIWKY